MGFSQCLLNQSAARVGFASVTGTYVTALTVVGNGVLMNIISNLNQEVVISLNGGLNDHIYVPPGVTPVVFALDFGTNELSYSGVIQLKHTGVAPASGAINILVVRRA